MADHLRQQLERQGVAVSSFEATRCYAAREFFDPVKVCTKWKAAEAALMKSATTKGIEEVMDSNCFEVGTAGSQPCLIINAQNQKPKEHEQSACLLSTLWACDAAMASQHDGSAKLTVGYNFGGAGLRNFSLEHALPFSKLFVNEYPGLVSDIYLIDMPWVLRQFLPLFQPLVSRRVRLVTVDSTDAFTKAADYEPSVAAGTSFAEHVQKVVPKAAPLELEHAVTVDWWHDEETKLFKDKCDLMVAQAKEWTFEDNPDPPAYGATKERHHPWQQHHSPRLYRSSLHQHQQMTDSSKQHGLLPLHALRTFGHAYGIASGDFFRSLALGGHAYFSVPRFPPLFVRAMTAKFCMPL